MQGGVYRLEELMNKAKNIMQNRLGGEKIAQILTRIIRDDCEQLYSVSFEDGVFVVNELRY